MGWYGDSRSSSLRYNSVLSSLVPITVFLLLGVGRLAAAATLAVTAVNSDGTNTGTARLGTPVTFTASVSGSSQTAVRWSSVGAGAIDGTGNYMPPVAMPSNPQVTVIATLASDPTVSASYLFELVNPIPRVGVASPSSLVPGSTQAVTLLGGGFVPGTVVVAGAAAVETLFVSNTKLVAYVPVPSAGSPSLSLQVRNPAPGGGHGTVVQESVVAPSISLMASGPDGTNTGLAALGDEVEMSAAVSAGDTSVLWSVNGAGSISASGLYSAPTSVPASATVTIIATLASNTAITDAYSLSLVNPVPRLDSGGNYPAQIYAGSTQTVSLTGSGFVPGTLVVMNGTPLGVTFLDWGHLRVNVPVGLNAPSSISLQLQNPAPGGGHGTVFQESVASPLTITATGPDGVNTGLALAGGHLQVSAALPGSQAASVLWSVQGAGSVSSSGTYTAPSVVPTKNSVTITAALVSSPSVTASYSFTLVNPVPSITSSSPSEVLIGGTTSLNISGRQFVPGSVVLVNGVAVPTIYVSATTLTAQVSVPASATGSIALEAQNPAPGGGPGGTLQIPVRMATLALTAQDIDGTNTGTDPLGYPVTFTPTIVGTDVPGVTYTLQGDGNVTGAGVYFPPATMPANPTVTITANLWAFHNVTATYTFLLTNPVPSVSAISPTQLVPNATNALVVSGSHFVPKSTILLGGTPIQTTYVNPTTLQASVAIAGDATGSLPVKVQNPSPGGGLSATYNEPVAVESIVLTAKSPDGVNRGFVRLGDGVSITAQITSPSGSNPLVWTIDGPGSIDSSGYGNASGTYYTIGLVMPSLPTVRVTAVLAANPSVTATYTFQIVNAVPTISGVYPNPLKSDQQQTLTVVGSGFTTSTSIIFNGSKVPTTFQSWSHVTASVFVGDAVIGPVPVQVQTPSPGGGVSPVYTQPIGLKTVQVSAYNGSVSNPSSLALGQRLQFLDQIVSGPGDPSASWSLSGGGTLSLTGMYQAPAAMPADPVVTISAALLTNPAAAGAYQLSLVYPVPVLLATSPAVVPSGAATSVTLRGTGFTPAATVTVAGRAIPVTFVSPSTIVTSISTGPGQSGTLAITVSNPAPGGGSGQPFALSIGTPATATANISLKPVGAIAENFLGYSVEWSGLPYVFGSSATEPNFVYRQLIANLRNGASYLFPIRIGGNSADLDTTPQPVLPQAELAADSDVEFTLGLTLGGAADPSDAVAQAETYVAGMPPGSIAAWELGNEPDNYNSNGDRPSNYSITGYLADVAAWSCALYPVAPAVPLSGPDWGSTYELKFMSSLEGQESPLVQSKPAGCPTGRFNPMATITNHYYGGYVDSGQTYGSDYLLSNAASSAGASQMASAVKTAHANHQLFRVDELNSIDQGGIAGISDTFSSALWLIDTMFEFANVGVDGVNVHGNEACAYCAFTFNIPYIGGKNVYVATQVAPIYYGMYFFQQANGKSSQLLPVTLQSAANIKVWATADADGNVRVVILNKDEDFRGNVTIALPGYGAAEVVRMLASSYGATSGITIGGQSFDGTVDGTPVGVPMAETISPDPDGSYVVPVQPVSAVLMTMKP